MKTKMMGSLPELMAHIGFRGTVDYLVREKADYLLSEALVIEAHATWNRMWMTAPRIKDINLSPEDEEKLWKNLELIQKGLIAEEPNGR